MTADGTTEAEEATGRRRLALPVIHHEDWTTSIHQADTAFACGADGVFLISHAGADVDALSLASHLERGRPGRIGVNMLTKEAGDAWVRARKEGLAMLWCDDAEVSGSGIGVAPQMMLAARRSREAKGGRDIEVYAGIAFKYRPAEPDPGTAARNCVSMGLVPTTSGDATGSAPDVAKIAAIRAAIGSNAPLAIASGMTPENVAAYLGLADRFLVATGVSRTESRFDRGRLRAFCEAVHDGAGAVAA